jgi:cardiolipin synthase
VDDEIEIIASGEKWLGTGYRSTFSTLKQMINSSKESLLMTVYILRDHSVIDLMQKALERGVIIDIFASRDEKTLNKKILSLNQIYPDLNIHLTNEMLHSKVMIIDKQKMIIGSANLTHSGLYHNYELGILIENSEIAYETEKLIRRLIE